MWLALLVVPAAAERPTEGGIWSFDASDDVRVLDSSDGAFRVHYSVEGPNQVRQGDADGDGIPDFAASAVAIAEDVIVVYEAAGFPRPVAEAFFGLELGGSPAIDTYLVDFGGDADGRFGSDACDGEPMVCTGFLVVENDFSGYGYFSPTAGLRVVVSHELFHGVQYAIDAEQPSWVSEGTAVWAERLYDPEVRDFLRFADFYLTETTRSLDRPPTGPMPTFSYSTALWWDFLTLRHDDALMVDLLYGMAGSGDDPLPAMDLVISDIGDDLGDAWEEFGWFNLRTGPRAGEGESYPYAEALGGVLPEVEGETVIDTNRFYPMATTYYRVDHPGGRFWFGIDEPAPEVRFSVHQVVGGAEDGPVGPFWVFDGDLEEATPVVDADLPPGGYWVVGTVPDPYAAESSRRTVCFSTEAAALACEPEPDVPGPGETGDDTGGEPEDPEHCGCSSVLTTMPFGWILVPWFVRRRR